MEKRGLASLVLLTIFTLGIYGIVWEVKTKNEMNALGANIPTAWLIIIPIANIYWLWKYSEGVEHVTGGKLSGVLSFLLMFLLGIIGMVILQSEFNKMSGQAALGGPQLPASPPMAPGMTAAPTAPGASGTGTMPPAGPAA